MPRGGARPNSGPKPLGYVPPEKSQDEANYDREHAEHERVKREQREFKLAVERAEYLPREAQRQAAATALAVLTQSMRSIPDNLERSLSLAPATVEAISIQIDAALTEVAAAFRAMSHD
jgi:hypothetical protein